MEQKERLKKERKQKQQGQQKEQEGKKEKWGRGEGKTEGELNTFTLACGRKKGKRHMEKRKGMGKSRDKHFPSGKKKKKISGR